MKQFKLFIIIVLSYCPLLSQQSEQLIIEYADSLVGTMQEANPYRIYEGNVSFINGDIKVKCNRAQHYFLQNLAVLQGDVKITQKKLVLNSPYVIYNGDSKIAYARNGVEIIDGDTYLSADSGRYNTNTRDAFFVGHVFIEDDSAVIYSDYVQHNRNTEESRAFGNSLIQGKYSNVAIYSDTILNFPKKNYTLATGNPLLVQIDTLTQDDEIKFDTLTVIAKKMEAIRNNTIENYIFTDSVEIFKKEILTKAGMTIYSKNQEIIQLFQNPIVWYDSTQLKADSIIIIIRNNQLQRLKTYNNAIAMVKNDSAFSDRINQVSGDSLFIDFWDGKPSKLTSYDNAKSLYFLVEGIEGSGAERKNTDKVVVEFENGEIRFIHWIGTTTGEYYPEVMVETAPKKYNLPLFQWRIDKPVKPNIEKRQ